MSRDSTMPNDSISLMMSEIYNKWWVQVRGFNENTKKEEVSAAVKIISNYVATNFDNYPIARKIALAYIDELEARTGGGYKNDLREKERRNERE